MNKPFVYFISLSSIMGVVMCILLFIVKPKSFPLAEAGVMDLRDYDFKSYGSIRLLGEWAFHWDDVVSEETYPFIVAQPPDLYVFVPSYWDNLSRIDRRVKSQGVATYSLRILKNFEDETDTLAIRTYNITPNADIYVDGRRISEIGNVDVNRKKSVPANKSVLVPIGASSDSMTIAISISNYHNVNAGLNRQIYLGSYEDLLAMREKYLTIDSIFLGGLLIMALYQFSVLMLRKKRIAPLYLGLIALLSFLFAGLKSEMALLTIFPNWDGEVRAKIIFLSFSLVGPIFVLYYSNLYPGHFHPKLRRFILPAALLMTLVVVFTPMDIYTRFMLPLTLLTSCFIVYTIFMLIVALYKTRNSLTMFVLVGVEMLVFSIILGVVDNKTQTIFQSIASAFFVFSVYQTVLEAKICSSAFVKVDVLSAEQKRLEKQNMKFFTQVFIDTNTGMYNKLLLNNFLQSRWTADNLKSKHSISMILVDVDYFKSYKDACGHEQSENMIARLSQVVHAGTADMRRDVSVRYGEDSFAVILIGIDEFNLYRTADRLRILVESENIEYYFAEKSRILTISVGCATLKPSKDNTSGTLIDLTRKALKLAKRSGRNRTEIITA